MFLGRLDFQIKSNGFRVEPGEIEAVIHEGFSVDWVAVIPWPVSADGSISGLVAWIAGTEGDANAIRNYCADRLPPYMVPGKIYWRKGIAQKQ